MHSLPAVASNVTSAGIPNNNQVSCSRKPPLREICIKTNTSFTFLIFQSNAKATKIETIVLIDLLDQPLRICINNHGCKLRAMNYSNAPIRTARVGSLSAFSLCGHQKTDCIRRKLQEKSRDVLAERNAGSFGLAQTFTNVSLLIIRVVQFWRS